MKSLRYAISGKTPHNMDDLISYCIDREFANKAIPNKASINVKAYKNQADKPITGTEYTLSADYAFQEKDRTFIISSNVWSSKTNDLSYSHDTLRLTKDIRVLNLLGIDCVLATPELENLLKKNKK